MSTCRNFDYAEFSRSLFYIRVSKRLFVVAFCCPTINLAFRFNSFWNRHVSGSNWFLVGSFFFKERFPSMRVRHLSRRKENSLSFRNRFSDFFQIRKKNVSLFVWKHWIKLNNIIYLNAEPWRWFWLTRIKWKLPWNRFKRFKFIAARLLIWND